MRTRFYYMLSELYSLFPAGHIVSPLSAKTLDLSVLSYSENLMNGITGDIEETIDKTLFQRYIWPECYNDIIFYVDVDHSPYIEATKPELAELDVKQLGGEIWRWLNDTIGYYSKIISLYLDQENNLLAKLHSSSETRVNDTPQNSGSYDTDTHVSNISKTTNESDAGTVMNRLIDVRKQWENLYKAWAKEFTDKFIII